MRLAALATLLLAPVLSGCCFPYGPVGSDTDCPRSTPVEKGFRVQAPTAVGDPSAPTTGLCVKMWDGEPGERIERRTDADAAAWFPVESPGNYTFTLYVTEPDDCACAYVLEGNGTYDGSGLVGVIMTYQNVSGCA